MVTISNETFTDPEFGGPISSYLLYLYQEFSVQPLPESIIIPNETWKEAINILYNQANQSLPNYRIDDTLIPKYEYTNDTNKVIVALSGGKDSTATLARLKDEGRDVTAYFLKRANLSYAFEEDASYKIAQFFEVPSVQDYLGRSGKTDWFENPIKNGLIMARMLEYALHHGFCTVSMGEFWDTNTEKTTIEYDASDNIDLLIAIEKAIRTHIPDFLLDVFWEVESTGYSYLVTHHPDVLPLIQSCIMPSRYMKQQLKYVEKYHIHGDPTQPENEAILPGRCMSCYKCMTEWMYLVIWKKLPFNSDYMNNKVLPTIAKHLKEMDRTVAAKGIENLTTEEILDPTLFIKQLRRYLKDPNEILKDIKHNHH